MRYNIQTAKSVFLHLVTPGVSKFRRAGVVQNIWRAFGEQMVTHFLKIVDDLEGREEPHGWPHGGHKKGCEGVRRETMEPG